MRIAIAGGTDLVGSALGRPTIFPMPAIAARLVLGGMARELLLGSQEVVPQVLQRTGFRHEYFELEAPLRHLPGRPAPRGSVAVGACPPAE